MIIDSPISSTNSFVSISTTPLSFKSTKVKMIGLTIFNAQNHVYAEPYSHSIIQSLARCREITLVSFDDFSVALIHNILQPARKIKMQKTSLQSIFVRFSAKQLNNHLRNLVTFLNLTACHPKVQELFGFCAASIREKIDSDRAIATQLSMLQVTQLMNAAKWAGGVEDPSFYEHLWALLKIEQAKPEATILTKRGYKGPGLFSEIRNYLVAEEWAAKHSPTSIYDAGSITQSTLMKISSVATLTFALAAAGTGGWALIGLAALPAAWLARKIYFACLDAPPEIYPLFDSRQMGTVSNSFIGRGEVINEVIATLVDGIQYPVLIGESGVGKSAIMLEIIRRIAANEIPGFDGKVVFFGSAAQITPENKNGPTHLQRVMSSILLHNDNVILCLDEIQAIFQAQDPTLAQYLKTVLDDKPGSLRFGIFATTQKEYDKYIAGDPTYARRFKPIDVQPLLKSNLLQLLHLEAMAIAPTLRVEEEAVNRVFELAKEQQNGSRLLLNRVLRTASKFNSYHISYQYEELKKAEIGTLTQLIQKEANLGVSETNRLLDQIAKSEQELSLLSENCDLERAVRAEFEVFQERQIDILSERTRLLKKIYPLVNKLVESKRFTSTQVLGGSDGFYVTNEKLLKQMIYTYYYNLSSGAAFVGNFAKAFSLVHLIDRNFVEQVFNLQATPTPAGEGSGAPPLPPAPSVPVLTDLTLNEKEQKDNVI
jgi:hypothetical protein